LSYQFSNSTNGIHAVDMTIERDTFNVVTGRIGSGKTTLLRVVQGLLTPESGRTLWNDREIHDPASFFVPPHSAYTSQIPRLFSGPLRDNLLMGIPEDEVDIEAALHAPY
jgi:ATP-binding cassette, subfamily B, bacterial